MSAKHIISICCAALAVTVILVLVGIHRLDVPIAAWCFQRFQRLQHLGNHLGSSLLVGGESLVALVLAIYRIATGRLHGLAKITVIACATSLSVFALNEVVLKTLFGMAPPYEVVTQGAPHVFHFFQGSWQSSFPSGHMVLATGFVTVFAGQQRWLLVLLSAGAALAAALLIAGGWHFVSDVVAGAFVGGMAGTTAAMLWGRHQASAVSR